MVFSRTRTLGRVRSGSHRLALWAVLASGGLLSSVGCQVEYAGMTLPSGKYFYDDVQYFAPGPEFPLANTQAATQRARMLAEGIEPLTAPPAIPPPGPGLGGPFQPPPISDELPPPPGVGPGLAPDVVPPPGQF